jgi:hypothetical protein
MKSNTRYFTVLVIFIFALALNAGAQGVPIQITSYDIDSTPRSGFGCWDHTYNGLILNLSRTASNVGYCFDGNQIAKYWSGIGTLNDGIINDGLPITPVITLHLDGMFTINKITVFGGRADYYAPPGALLSATVEIGGVAVVDKLITSIGSANALGIFPDGEFNLIGTPLADRPTNMIVLRDFVSSFYGQPFDQFSITEITVDGSLPPVPMPVGIDIRPGNQRNKIELGEDDRVKVAVLSGTTFDAPASVDRTSLTFGKTGDERSLAFCNSSPRDVNADGLLDLICGFKIIKMGFQLGDTTGVLKGKTLSGTAIRGEDAVSISPM